MKAQLPASEFVIRWLSLDKDADQILGLRRRVFKEEQGLGDDMVRTPRDDRALHMGAFHKGQLVSSLSVYLYQDEPDALARWGLPASPGRFLQFTKRAELPEFRGSGLAALVGAAVCRDVIRTLRPEGVFLVLLKEHAALASWYRDTFGFTAEQVLGPEAGGVTVIASPDESAVMGTYLRARKLAEAMHQDLGIPTPSLVRHLADGGRSALVPVERFAKENLYTAPLSLQVELPRLSAQTRIIHAEQKGRLAAVDFPKVPARFLDLGAGPGVYLSQLSREPQFQGYAFTGLDLAPPMVAWAKLNRPEFRWLLASAYATGEPDRSYDVVHANFVFIHLFNPELGLLEVQRILAPGGLLYVVDVNDSTFQGPPEVARMVDAHHDMYHGDRNILSSLPGLAPSFGLELVKTFSTRGSNTATGEDYELVGEELKLPRMLLWGMFAFIGQREELAEVYQAARDHYFRTDCEMSICIQTHVYRRKD
jgi:SAM-dependent methyltransferase